MSVTIYLTDHNGRKIAFFYRIDSERYLTCPQLLWCCRDHPEYQGTAESKEDFMEQCKSVMRELNKNLTARKKCKECDSDLHLRENESNLCTKCNPITT